MTKNCAVLFDFDGTVMDTEPAIIASYYHVFELHRRREDFTPEMQIEVLGPALDVEMKKFFPEIPVDICLQEYREYQNQNIRKLVRPMEHAMELFSWLRKEGYRTGLISTRFSESLRQISSLTGMDQLVDIMIGHDEVVKGKPDPEGILLAVRKLQCTSSIYVGDSATDIRAGKNAGSYTVAALTKPEKEEELRASEPDTCVYDLLELKKIITEYSKGER
ncbi:MAG: HAD family hydrolase [Erysipelotrichia bacterium]|nr:HAD family hydrolase [Erysipelotrichia bacterium]